MIIGIGHDMTEIARIRKLLTGEKSEKFLRRIFTNHEHNELEAIVGERRRVEYVAGRYAVKEAVSKAFGCGISGKMGFHDIEIQRDPNGKPSCLVGTKALVGLGYDSRNIEVHVSITHERELASAFVVVESNR